MILPTIFDNPKRYAGRMGRTPHASETLSRVRAMSAQAAAWATYENNVQADALAQNVSAR